MRFPKPLTDVSIAINRITFGPKGWTVCARVYHRKCIKSCNVSKHIVTAIDTAFWFDPEHCRKSYMQRNRP